MSRKPFLVLFLQGPPNLSAYVVASEDLSGSLTLLTVGTDCQLAALCQISYTCPLHKAWSFYDCLKKVVHFQDS